jgi:lipid-binding SYLF domain-containing protein
MVPEIWSKTVGGLRASRLTRRKESMAMITERRWGFALVMTFLIGSSTQAADDAAVIEKATRLLEEISSTPESGIPPQFLREAKGIAIVPHIVETQLGVGRKRGHGVYLARNEKGEWGNPELIEISGLSAGAEAGREVTDMVMIYRTQKAADRHAEQSVALGASAGFHRSMHHPHKFHGPGPDSQSKKDVFTYTRRQGILIGARIIGEHKWGTSTSLEGPKTVATVDPKTTDAGAKATRTEESDPKPRPGRDTPEAARLKRVLTALTTAPAAELAEKGTKDPKVAPANGTNHSTETASPPR